MADETNLFVKRLADDDTRPLLSQHHRDGLEMLWKQRLPYD
ncbi:shikimate kinase [Anoxybacillus tepidamans]|uniref:Shikimate kinase n=1 Tax=Anoxybacteroides tepidamans TaxID=265948 RepID=A0A7W8MV58_9BACL|nr:hypothetical protein [Anoxybacillus tepidamans]MBB5325227.1 shikimate kinase [Anoxybacillus tepidamans]